MILDDSFVSVPVVCPGRIPVLDTDFELSIFPRPQADFDRVFELLPGNVDHFVDDRPNRFDTRNLTLVGWLLLWGKVWL